MVVIETETRPQRRATPYLDRQIPLPARRRLDTTPRWWLVAIFSALMLVKVFLVLVIVLLACILVHELGHVLGDLLVGFRFNYIRVGPLRVDRGGRVSWLWTWRGLTSGATSSYPVSRSGLRWKRFTSVAAGPAANFGAAYFASKILPENNSILAGACFFFVGLSSLFGLINMLPFGTAEPVSDGLQLWILLFSKKRRDRLLLILGFVADAKRGDLQTLDKYELLEQSSSIKDGSIQELVTNWLAYVKTAAAKDFDSAGLYLENCLAASSSATQELRSDLIVEAARFQALRRCRTDLAREWLNLEISGKVRPRRFFPEAVVLYREGCFRDSLAKTEEGLSLLGTRRDRGALNEVKALEGLRNKLRQHGSSNDRDEILLSFEKAD